MDIFQYLFGHSRNESHSSAVPRSRSNLARRRRGTRDESFKINDHNSPTSSPATKEQSSKSDLGGRRNWRASGDPKTTTPISASKCTKIEATRALVNQAIVEVSVYDEKKWDLGKSWGFGSFAKAEPSMARGVALNGYNEIRWGDAVLPPAGLPVGLFNSRITAAFKIRFFTSKTDWGYIFSNDQYPTDT